MNGRDRGGEKQPIEGDKDVEPHSKNPHADRVEAIGEQEQCMFARIQS